MYKCFACMYLCVCCSQRPGPRGNSDRWMTLLVLGTKLRSFERTAFSLPLSPLSRCATYPGVERLWWPWTSDSPVSIKCWWYRPVAWTWPLTYVSLPRPNSPCSDFFLLCFYSFSYWRVKIPCTLLASTLLNKHCKYPFRLWIGSEKAASCSKC